MKLFTIAKKITITPLTIMMYSVIKIIQFIT